MLYIDRFQIGLQFSKKYNPSVLHEEKIILLNQNRSPPPLSVYIISNKE